MMSSFISSHLIIKSHLIEKQPVEVMEKTKDGKPVSGQPLRVFFEIPFQLEHPAED